MKKIIKNINTAIVKLNRPAYISLLLGYLIVLVAIVFIVSPNNDYIIVPRYDHQYFPEDIGAQITIVPIRELSDSGEESVRYSVSARLHGKLNENNNDPAYSIKRFQMSALMKNNLMHYFTEQVDRNTPISHSYTILPTSTTIIDAHAPQEVFVKINYIGTNGEQKVQTFLEKINLELTNKEQYSNNHVISHFDKEQNKNITDLDLKFIATDAPKGGYYTSVWIDVKNLKKVHHVDLQTWIVTEDGRTLPFMSVYGYTDEKNTFFLSNREAQGFLKPKELYAKLTYYTINEEGKTVNKTIHYKESFENLPANYATTPDNPGTKNPNTNQPKDRTWIYIGIASFALIGGALGVTYIIVRKKQDRLEEK